MKRARFGLNCAAKFYFSGAVIAAFASWALALDGQIQIHDPSTVIQCDGKYYVYGTGGARGLISDDGWTWRRGYSAIQALPDGRPGPEILSRGGAGTLAPDVINLADRYCLYYAATAAQPKAAIGMMWNKTLDPNSPDYKWQDGGAVAWSDGIEDCNAIDPGVLHDPTDGKLWLTYGSYFGYIRLVELDPKTGKRLNPNTQPVNLAVNCEASVMIYRDGWYYLLATHGSCCAGSASGYNIRVGRSRKVTGPFVDNMGVDMIEGGGKLCVGSDSRHIGPGHFGLMDLGQGVQKFSCHYEADLDRGGTSVLDIRPLLWKDGWPVAGDNFRAGTYQIESVRTGTVLEMAVEGVPVGGQRRGRRGGFGFGGGPGPASGPARAQRGPGGRGAGAVAAASTQPIPAQDVMQVSKNWPAGNVDVRMANYLAQVQQHWAITPVKDAGGYPGSPYFRISIAGTDRTLAATSEGELVTLPAFTGGPEQLWRLDQLTDGTWRVMPKSVPDSKEALALSAVGSSSATLAEFHPDSDKQRWNLKAP